MINLSYDSSEIHISTNEEKLVHIPLIITNPTFEINIIRFLKTYFSLIFYEEVIPTIPIYSPNHYNRTHHSVPSLRGTSEILEFHIAKQIRKETRRTRTIQIELKRIIRCFKSENNKDVRL